MSKQNLYISTLAILIIGFIIVELSKPKPLDLRDSFTQYDVIPKGTRILFEQLPVLFPEKDITINQAPIFESESPINTRAFDYTPNNWIFINSSFALDKWETEILLDKVKDGGSVFVAARTFGGYFADSLKINTRLLPHYFSSAIGDSLWYVSVGFDQYDKKEWLVQGRFIEQAFSSYDSTITKELGYIESSDVNFLELSIGEGKLYLHSIPEMFTNYFIRDTTYTDYSFAVLSRLPIDNTLWDEYYKAGRQELRSPMRFIISQEFLKWAWVLAIITLLLFFIFRSKRQQRIIPILVPPKNTSIQFASTVAQLYLERNSHKDIALKKIRFFLDYLRTHIYVDTTSLNDELASTISLRSGILKEQLLNLFKTIASIEEAENISETDLKKLTDQIDYFYKNSSR